jgi:hypothetical protein
LAGRERVGRTRTRSPSTTPFNAAPLEGFCAELAESWQ